MKSTKARKAHKAHKAHKRASHRLNLCSFFVSSLFLCFRDDLLPEENKCGASHPDGHAFDHRKDAKSARSANQRIIKGGLVGVLIRFGLCVLGIPEKNMLTLR